MDIREATKALIMRRDTIGVERNAQHGSTEAIMDLMWEAAASATARTCVDVWCLPEIIMAVTLMHACGGRATVCWLPNSWLLIEMQFGDSSTFYFFKMICILGFVLV